MKVEYTIMVIVLIMTLILGMKTPRSRRREALVAFLALQALTWLMATYFVQLGMIKFPIRIFTKATRVNMIFEFLFYPMIFSWFYLNFNKKDTRRKRLGHYIWYLSIIVWFVFLTEKYTGLSEFLEMKGYKHVIRLYISFFIEFWLAKTYTVWFFKNNSLLKKGSML